MRTHSNVHMLVVYAAHALEQLGGSMRCSHRDHGRGLLHGSHGWNRLQSDAVRVPEDRPEAKTVTQRAILS